MLNQDMTPLFDALKNYIAQKTVPFHVPGHKNGQGLAELADFLGENVFRMDLNGMDSLDYYQNPLGPIKEAQKLFADAFGARKAFFLVNGTSCGIQTMIMSACRPGDKIIIPRNIHKSVINGLVLSGAQPIYIEPEIDEKLGLSNGLDVDKLKKVILANKGAKALFLINPTYFGVTSNLKEMVELAHKHDLLVLVDEAHGTHMYFNRQFPLTAMAAGADMSSLSVHKTGGSLTQSSALLIGSERLDSKRVRETLNLLSTSSASYLLLASLDLARRQLALKGEKMLEEVLAMARWARKEINNIEGLNAFGREMIGHNGCHDFDESKLGINLGEIGLSGYQLEEILKKEYNIQVELADLFNILAVISIGDKKENLEVLLLALREVSKKFGKGKKFKRIPLPKPTKNVVSPRAAYFMAKKTILLKESVGRIAGETIMAYPPGIPIICAGELLSQEIIDYLNILKTENCHLQGQKDQTLTRIEILDTAVYLHNFPEASS